MIKVPDLIYDITGGDKVLGVWQVWDDYISSIGDRVKEVSGVRDLAYFCGLGDFRVEDRRIESIGKFGLVGDDCIGFLLLDGYSVVQMINMRDEKNYHKISFSNVPEDLIDNLSLGLRKRYERILDGDFYEYFNRNNS